MKSAIRAGNAAAVAERLRRGESINFSGRWKCPGGTIAQPPLHYSASMGHTAVAKLLLDVGAELDEAYPPNGWTPLFYATIRGRAAIAALLVEAGADVNMPTNRGITPLFRADGIEVAELLLHAGAKVNQVNNIGETPLHEAARDGRHDVSSLLLEASADVNRASHDGETPLHLVSRAGHVAVVKLLLSAGADADAADQHGCTALYSASLRRHAAVVHLLVAAGADANRANHLGNAPLLAAVCSGRLDIAALLLEAAADVNRTSNGETPLLFAVCSGDLDLVKLLCSHGALRTGSEVAEATNDGFPRVAAWLASTADCITPLHYPTLVPPERARRLLRAGADLRAARSHGGHTPLSIACELSARGVAPTGSTARLIIVHHRIRQWLSIARLASFLRRVCVRAAERRRKRQRHEL